MRMSDRVNISLSNAVGVIDLLSYHVIVHRSCIVCAASMLPADTPHPIEQSEVRSKEVATRTRVFIKC